MVYCFGLIHIHVIMRLGMQGIKLLILINLQSLDYQPSIKMTLWCQKTGAEVSENVIFFVLFYILEWYLCTHIACIYVPLFYFIVYCTNTLFIVLTHSMHVLQVCVQARLLYHLLRPFPKLSPFDPRSFLLT